LRTADSKVLEKVREWALEGMSIREIRELLAEKLGFKASSDREVKTLLREASVDPREHWRAVIKRVNARRRTLTEDEEEQVVKWVLEDQLTYSEVIERVYREFGKKVSPSVIFRVLRSRGVKVSELDRERVKEKRRKIAQTLKIFSEEEEKRIAELYEKGYSVSEIVKYCEEKLGKKASKYTVLRALKKRGVKLREKSKVKMLLEKGREEMVKMAMAGASAREIAEAMSERLGVRVSKTTVTRALRKAGVRKSKQDSYEEMARKLISALKLEASEKSRVKPLTATELIDVKNTVATLAKWAREMEELEESQDFYMVIFALQNMDSEGKMVDLSSVEKERVFCVRIPLKDGRIVYYVRIGMLHIAAHPYTGDVYSEVEEEPTAGAEKVLSRIISQS